MKTDPEKEKRRLTFLVEADRLAEEALAEVQRSAIHFRSLPVMWEVTPQPDIPGFPYPIVEVLVRTRTGLPIDRFGAFQHNSANGQDKWLSFVGDAPSGDHERLRGEITQRLGGMEK